MAWRGAVLRWLAFWPALALALLLGLLLAWYLLPRWLPRAAGEVLARQGWQVQRLQVDRPILGSGLTGVDWHLAELVLVRQESPGNPQVALHIRDLAFSATFTHLFRGGLPAMTAGRVWLALGLPEGPASGSSDPSVFDPGMALSALQGDWLYRFAKPGWRVADLQVEIAGGRYPQLAGNWRGGLELDSSGLALSLRNGSFLGAGAMLDLDLAQLPSGNPGVAARGSAGWQATLALGMAGIARPSGDATLAAPPTTAPTEPVLRLHLVLPPAAPDSRGQAPGQILTAGLTLQLHAARDAAWLQQLQALLRSAELLPSQGEPLGPLLSERLLAGLHLQIDTRLSWSDERPLQAALAGLQVDGSWQLQANGALPGAQPPPSRIATQGQTPPWRAQLAGELSWADQTARLTLLPGAQLVVSEPWTQGQFTVLPWRVGLTAPLVLSHGVDDSRVTPTSAVLSPLRVNAGGWSLGAEALLLNFRAGHCSDAGKCQMGLAVELPGLVAALLPGRTRLPPVDLTLQGKWQAGQLALDWRGHMPRTGLQISGEGHWQPDTGDLLVRLQGDQRHLPAWQPVLADLAGRWPSLAKLRLTAGSAHLRAQFQGGVKAARRNAHPGTGRLTGAATLKLTAAAGSWADLSIAGANLGLDGKLTPRAMVADGNLFIERLDVGLPVTDFKLRMALASDGRDPVLERLAGGLKSGTMPLHLAVKQFEANFAGGRIALTPAQGVVDLKRLAPVRPLALSASLDGVDLGQLLAMTGQPDVVASGALDGSLPLLWQADGLRMDAGTLTARTPGVLRYKGTLGAGPAAPASGSLADVATLLQDFHYRQLRAQVSFAPDGTTHIATEFLGSNPAWQQGREVRLNLNLEQNVLTLLRSLRLGNGLGRGVEDVMQRRLAPGSAPAP